jgi:uncharacterized protein
MPLDYFAPGVYVEEVDRGSRPIEGVSLSVPGFIGFTEDVRGDAEVFQPMMVTTWDQYLEYFGKPGSDGFTDFDAYLPFAVYGWFLNGGGRCWVSSIGTKLPGSEPPPPEKTATKLLTSSGRTALLFNLKGTTADAEDGEALALPAATGPVTVKVETSTPRQPEDPDAEPPVDDGQFFKLTVKKGATVLETYDNLTMKEDVEAELGNYVVTALQESEAIDISLPEGIGTISPLSYRPLNGVYEVSPPPPFIQDPDRLPRELQGKRDDRTGVQGIFEIDDVAMIACPDLMRVYQAGLMDIDQVHGVMEMMVSMCENSAPSPPFRMVVLDPPPIKPGKNENRAVPPEQQKPQDVANWLRQGFNRRSMFAALYYPWIKVANPRNGGRPIAIPPCGHMMGVWCRTDETRGLFKAPANDTPRGVIGLSYETNFREQELLNPLGINCIRNFSNYNRGIKIWGARTLAEPDNIQWRYIPVRRMMSYIEKSIEIGTQWVVFEPNDSSLWGRVTRTVSSFLEGLWRQGALVGGTAAESFFVKCDGELNTPDTMMMGRLYIEVGVAPVRPAEFVIFRISQWAPGQ